MHYNTHALLRSVNRAQQSIHPADAQQQGPVEIMLFAEPHVSSDYDDFNIRLEPVSIEPLLAADSYLLK